MSTITTPKELLIEAIRELPDDSSCEEILRELVFARMIERGLADSRTGRTASHEEMGRRIALWASNPGPLQGRLSVRRRD